MQRGKNERDLQLNRDKDWQHKERLRMKSKLVSYVKPEKRLLDSSECMGQDVDHSSSFSIDRRSQLVMDKDGWKEEEEKEYESREKKIKEIQEIY